jgi:hypothetical protein
VTLAAVERPSVTFPVATAANVTLASPRRSSVTFSVAREQRPPALGP